MPTFIDAPTRLQSHILRENMVRREIFDPANLEHQRSLRTFIQTGNWGTVQFFAEQPYVTVPETVMRKYILWTMGKSAD
jgi:hypothetical protein